MDIYLLSLIDVDSYPLLSTIFHCVGINHLRFVGASPSLGWALGAVQERSIFVLALA